MTQIHDRVNELSASLNARWHRWQQSPGRTVQYTKVDADLDEAVTDLIRSLDWLVSQHCVALKPFAEALVRYETKVGEINTAKDEWKLGEVDYLTVGDLKRAAQALGNTGVSVVEAVVAAERERCAKIADGMNSTQNIGNRIRYGLGHEMSGGK